MYGAMVMFLQVDAMSETINDLVNLCGKNLWDGGYSVEAETSTKGFLMWQKRQTVKNHKNRHVVFLPGRSTTEKIPLV